MKVLSMAKAKSILPAPGKKELFWVTLGVAMTTSFFAGVTTLGKEHADNQELQSTPHILAQLNTVQQAIGQLQESVSRPVAEVDLSVVSAQLEQLSSKVQSIRPVNEEALTKAIVDSREHTESTIGSQLQGIHDAVVRLDSQQNPVRYLSAKSLPFRVISIDSIQEIPVASVVWDYKTVPMERGDSLAGWKIVRIEYGTQQIELENAKKEHIRVTATEIG